MAERNIRQLFDLGQVVPVTDGYLEERRTKMEIQIDDQRAVGIEVEVEKATAGERIHVKSRVWTAHGDGSLRNNGMEYITFPIPVCYAPAALEDLFVSGVNQCSFTPRTSIHVHFNCQDLTKDQVNDVVLLYLHFERQLYHFVGRQRIKNIYCVPINDTTLGSQLLVKRADLWAHTWKKYTGLNLLPLESKGTIEFRQMHGTSNVTKLSQWIRLLDRLFLYALKKGTTNLREELAAVHTVPQLDRLGESVFMEDWRLLTAKPAVSDALAAKQCFISGKTNLDLATYNTSPFAAMGV
jgi:hypothetical protein